MVRSLLWSGLVSGLMLWMVSGRAGGIGNDPRWRMVHPVPLADAGTAVTHGDGVWVAVGRSGLVTRSLDGRHWSGPASGSTADLTGIAHGPGGFVAVGTGGTLLHSMDGLNWERQAVGTQCDFLSVGHGAPGYVALGQDFECRVVLHSLDGRNWRPAAVPPEPASMTRVAYGNGRYVAVGEHPVVSWSVDGLVWAPAGQVEGAAFTDLSFDGESFWAVGYRPVLYRSVDGEVWEEFPLAFSPGGGKRLVRADGVMVLAVGTWGGTAYYRSTDLREWAPVAHREMNQRLGGLAHAAGRWVCVGTEFVSSIDGAEWELPASAVPGWYGQPAAGPDSYLHFGLRGQVRWSRDGVNWWEVGQVVPASGWIHSATWGAGRWVVFAASSEPYVSEDGIHWVQQSNPRHLAAPNLLVYGAAGFVGFGFTTVHYSVDGSKWTQQTSPLGFVPECLEYHDPGLYLAAAAPDHVAVSVDGRQWKADRVAGAGRFVGSAWGNGIHLLADPTRFWTSPDGFAWTREEFEPVMPITAVAFHGDRFVTVGEKGYTGWSLDGRHWNEGWIPGRSDFDRVVAGARGVVATGPGVIAWLGPPDSELPVCRIEAPAVGTVFEEGETIRLKATVHPAGAVVDQVEFHVNGVPVAVAADPPFEASIRAETWAPLTVQASAIEPGGSRAWSQLVRLQVAARAWAERGRQPDEAPGPPTRLAGIITGLAASDTTAVAVGLEGLLAFSADGIVWGQCPRLTTAGLQAVVHHQGRFIAVGDRGTALTSPDGVVWDHADTGTTRDLLGLATDGRQVLAVGAGGTLRRSQDGATWEGLPFPSTATCRDIAFGNGRFVAVAAQLIFMSADAGVTWKIHSSHPGDFRSVAFGNGRFLAGADLFRHYVSEDGVSWFATEDRFQGATRMRYAKGAFTRVPMGAFHDLELSADGRCWVSVPLGGSAQVSMHAALEFNGTLILGGDPGMILQLGEPRWVAPSFRLLPPDAGLSGRPGHPVRWTVAADPDAPPQRVLLELNGRLVQDWSTGPFTFDWFPAAAGRYEWVARAETTPGVWVAAEPVAFDVTFANPETRPAPGRLTTENALAWGNGLFVFAGSQTVWVSPDGGAWSRHPLEADLTAIAHGQGRFIGVGRDLAGVSDTGFHWTLRPLETPATLNAVASDGERWVAVGNQGAVRVSIDGEQWEASEPFTDRSLLQVAAGPGGFLALDDQGTLHRPVGIEPGFTAERPGGEAIVRLASNGSFWLVQDAAGRLWRSTDGRGWTRLLAQPGERSPTDLRALEGAFLALGQDRRVWLSNEGTRWTSPFALSLEELLAAAAGPSLLLVAGSPSPRLQVAPEPPADPPRAVIISPPSGAFLDRPSPVTIEVRAEEPAEPAGPVEGLALWIDGRLEAEVDEPRLTLHWTPSQPGVHHLVASVRDRAGHRFLTDTVPIEYFESFPQWLRRFFTEAELDQPQLVGPDQDPDDDGWSNLSEYIHALDPRRPNLREEALRVAWHPGPDGDRRLSLAVRHGPPSLALRREVHHTDTLSAGTEAWQLVTRNRPPIPLGDGAWLSTWEIQIPQDSAAGFLRFRTLFPPPGP